MPEFSDYIVFADESGDHSLISLDPDYPVFVLALCLFLKEDYAAATAPSVLRFKFKHFLDAGEPFKPTVRKLVEWYVRDAATRRGLDEATASAALAVLLDEVPEERPARGAGLAPCGVQEERSAAAFVAQGLKT